MSFPFQNVPSWDITAAPFPVVPSGFITAFYRWFTARYPADPFPAELEDVVDHVGRMLDEMQIDGVKWNSGIQAVIDWIVDHLEVFNEELAGTENALKEDPAYSLRLTKARFK